MVMQLNIRAMVKVGQERTQINALRLLNNKVEHIKERM